MASVGQARVLSASTVAETRWLRLSTLSYLDQKGRQRQWDSIARTTRPAESDVDGVAILALLRIGNSIETLLVEQFRPPMNTFTIELPAGLIDSGETAAEAAVRGELARAACQKTARSTRWPYSDALYYCPGQSHAELREETGYFGSIISTSPPVALSPGLTNESVRLCVVDVDLDAPENASPKQCLEDGEFIRVRRVPLERLEQLLATRASDGLVPFCGLQMLVEGFFLGVRTRSLQDSRGTDGPG
jgi:8-oxo-dGTP pyrophosphatase MutT (NUDIX family)